MVTARSSVCEGQKRQCHNRFMLVTLGWAPHEIHVMVRCPLNGFYWTCKVRANKSGLILYGQRIKRDLTHTRVSMSHIFPPRLLTSGAACCIIERGRRVTYIKETGTAHPSIIWEKREWGSPRRRPSKYTPLQYAVNRSDDALLYDSSPG